MYARMIRTSLKPGMDDEAVRIFRENILPAARQQHGFEGASLLLDRETHVGVSITQWASMADLQAGESSGYLQEQIAKLGECLAARPDRTVFEVALSVTAPTYA